MKNKQPKYAYFSIDVERFIDTECVSRSNRSMGQNMLDGLDVFMGILDKYNIKATMFVLSDYVDGIYEKLKKYLENGHKMALHGKEHIPPNLMTNEQFKADISEAKAKLEKLFGISVNGYRAPCFGIDRDKLDILRELGFKYDSSRLDFPLAKHFTKIDMKDFDNPVGEVYSKKDFVEFGVSVQKVIGGKFPVSGGGYIRILNWIFAKTLLKRYIRKNGYYMFYVHPFELSTHKAPKIKNLKFYDKVYLSVGQRSYPFKIEYIIKKLKKYGYQFITYEDSANQIINKKTSFE